MSTLALSTCQAFVDFDDRNDFCGEPAIGVVFAACEHEHVNERPVCAACAAELQRAEEEGGWICFYCDHECRFCYGIRFDGGETVVLSGQLP